MKIPPLVLLTGLLLLVFSPSAAAQSISSSESLIEAMHDAYAGKRAESLTFVQETIFPRQDGSKDTTLWYEAALPGKLRIDFAPLEDGNGAIYADGMQYSFQNGELVNSRPNVNPFMVALMDVYLVPAKQTTHVLDTLGFDLSTFREDEWEGRAVYVIGAAKDDLSSRQVWVDQERLYAVRIIEPVGPNGQYTLDAQVTKHEKMGEIWQESEIIIYINGNLFQEEKYTNIRPGAPVDPALFNPENWRIEKPYWK